MAPREPVHTVPVPETPEQFWTDPAYLAQAALANAANVYWGGEAMPSMLLMGGWTVCYGATPHFNWGTIWHDPIAIDWNNPPTFELNWQDPWLVRYLATYQTVLQAAGWDDFLVGQPCLLPGNDLLPAIMGNNEFLVNLLDRPEWMKQAILAIAKNQATLFHHFRKLASAHAFPYSNAGWMPLWVPESYITTQSDVSCMLSAEMFDEFVLPELDALGREFNYVWYHLDGSRAFQHLPRLLSLPYLRFMQFMPEPDQPPNGPAWLDLYRRIQHAGKIVHIQVFPGDVEELVRHLDPGLLCLETSCSSVAEADELLAAAKRWV